MAEPIGALRAELSANAAQFERDMGRARNAVKKSSSSMSKNMMRFRASVDKGVKSLFSLRSAAVAAAGATGLFLLAKRSIETADSIGKMARQLGVSAEELQELRFAAQRAGIEQGRLDQSMVAFTKRLGEAKQGTGQAKDALEELGISMEDLKDATPVEALAKVADKLSEIEDPMRRNAILADLFSRSGIIMGNMLTDGAAGMAQMRQRARELGVVLSNDIVRRAEQAADELGDMEKVLSVAATSAGLELMPAMRSLSQALTDPNFLSSIRELGSLMARLIVFFTQYHAEILSVAAALVVFAKSQDIGGKKLGKARVPVQLLISALAGLATHLVITGGESASAAEKIEEFNQQMEALGAGGGSVERAGQAVVSLTAAVQTRNRELEDLIARYRMTPEFVQTLTDTIELENTARRLNIDLSTEQGRAWADQFARGQELRRVLEDVRRITEETVTPTKLYADEVARLNELLASGHLSQQQFNQALEAAKSRLKDATEETSRLDEVAERLGFTFTSSFEDAIVEGKKFSEVIKGLEQDLIRLILRTAVIEPLAGGLGSIFSSVLGGAIGGLFGGGGGALTGSVAGAGGGASGHPGFARSQHGNIFTRPSATFIAETGKPEGVLPLTRIGSDLGVKAQGVGGGNVNVIINNSGGEVRTEERRAANGEIELIVHVDRALGQMVGRGEGQLFRSFQRNFGRSVAPVSRG